MTAIDEVLAASEIAPQFIFKHSTTCPISAAAHRRVSDYLKQPGVEPSTFHLVKVIESRPVSNAIAQRLGVTHQSPQLILVDHGVAAWDTSHGNITANAIAGALDLLD